METQFGWVSIVLTPEEMDELDDGQGWYESGDTVRLGGWIDVNTNTGTLDLIVNDDAIHDNWTTMINLPPRIQQRLIDSL